MSLIKLFKYKFYYLKYYYKFLFVHKPLCEAFRADTLFIFNKIYFCRSCFMLYLGFIFSFISSFLFLTKKYLNGNAPILIIFTLFIILTSNPNFYKNYTRKQRDVLRLSTGIIMGLIAAITIKFYFWGGIFAILCLLLCKKIYNKERKKVDICRNCPKLNTPEICDGYTMQKLALLDFEEFYSKNLTIRKELLND